MRYTSLLCGSILLAAGAAVCLGGARMNGQRIELPEPILKGDTSVEEAIGRRRSRRSFAERALTLRQVSQLLWSAQGATGERGRLRAAPSAGATYPLEVLVAVGDGGVERLPAGIYRYVSSDHSLMKMAEGDARARVARAALEQESLAAAPVDILIAADYRRTTRRYGERGVRYVHMEAGHVGQNIYLQAEALGLATVAVGAFEDEKVAAAFGLPDELKPLYLMPVGHAR